MADETEREHRVRLPERTYHRLAIVAAVLKKGSPSDLAREVLDDYTRKAVIEARYPAEPREGPGDAAGPDGSGEADADQPSLFASVPGAT